MFRLLKYIIKQRFIDIIFIKLWCILKKQSTLVIIYICISLKSSTRTIDSKYFYPKTLSLNYATMETYYSAKER